MLLNSLRIPDIAKKRVYPGFATKIRQKFISLLLWKPLSHTIERCPTECGQSVG